VGSRWGFDVVGEVEAAVDAKDGRGLQETTRRSASYWPGSHVP
jgi:hypothetical protein